MFSFFKKQKGALRKHHYKNLSIALPSHWEYELEEGGQQACYDPKSQSTLRINILKASHPQQTADQSIASLLGNQTNIITSKGYILTNPIHFDTVDGGQNITLVTWKLINHKSSQKIIAVLTYTVLSVDINSSTEKETISLIEKSLLDADLE